MSLLPSLELDLAPQNSGHVHPAAGAPETRGEAAMSRASVDGHGNPTQLR